MLYSGPGDDTWQPVMPMSMSHAIWRAVCPEGKSTEVGSLLLSLQLREPAKGGIVTTRMAAAIPQYP